MEIFRHINWRRLWKTPSYGVSSQKFLREIPKFKKNECSFKQKMASGAPIRKTSAIDCRIVPPLVSIFVDTFVDYPVSGGLFLPEEPESLKRSNGSLQTIFSQPRRLIAIGDIHGDLPKSEAALRLAGLACTDGHWSGGATTVVQVGDIFNRCGDEIKLWHFFARLKREAAKSGGLVITMNGNHEIMNINGDCAPVLLIIHLE